MLVVEEEHGTRGQIEAQVPRPKRRPRKETQVYARPNLGFGTSAVGPKDYRCRTDGGIDPVNHRELLRKN